MTRRRSSYRSLGSLQRDNRRCRACAEAGYPLESMPVFEGHTGQRAYLLGQAPGAVEGAQRRPWRGRAGQTLIVPVGGLALHALLGRSDLTACVGNRLERDGAPVVPLPHPSGASGWLNVSANRARLERALALLRDSL